MKNTEWSQDDIRRVAGSSGKPLEVSCAEAFLAAGWKARLGSHFIDTRGIVRELDVIAEKERYIPQSAVTARVRVLLSCRGFPAEESPLAYSVSNDHVPSFEPRLLSSHRAAGHPLVTALSSGPLPELETKGAACLLRATKLESSRPLVAFDVLQRTEKRSGPGKEKTVVAAIGRRSDGDRSLHSALESPVQAAFFWLKEDLQMPPVSFAALNVPVCVLRVPLWDVCLDGGKVGSVQIIHRGFRSNLYPHSTSPIEVMTLVWVVDEMEALIAALDSLYEWFCEALVGGP